MAKRKQKEKEEDTPETPEVTSITTPEARSDSPEEESGEDTFLEPEVITAEPIEVLPPLGDDDDDQEDSAPKEALPPARQAREIVPYDPLDAYLREISRHPSLSREEEKELAIRYYENQDRDAAVRLISGNLWLVVKIARDYEKAARSLLDLIQEGNMGLLEAIKNFDPYREVRFPSYAVWWIKAYIIRYVIANCRLVKIGTTQAQRKLFFNLKKERDKLEREGFHPGPKLIADRLNVKESDVIEMEQRLNAGDLSVDAPLPGDSESNLLTLLSNNELTAEEIMSRRETQKLLHDSIQEFSETLNEKELEIFTERLLSEDKATLQDLAEKFDLSRERVRQIENRVKDKLKKYLLEKFGASIESLVNAD